MDYIYQALLAEDSNVIFFKNILETLKNSENNQRNYIIYFIKQIFMYIVNKDTEIILFWVSAHSGILGNRGCE